MANKAIFLVDDDGRYPFWKKETIEKVFEGYEIVEFTGSSVSPPSSSRFYDSIKETILSHPNIQKWYGIMDMHFEWEETPGGRKIEEDGGTRLACQLINDEQIKGKVKEIIIASTLAQETSVPKGCYGYPYSGAGITQDTWGKIRNFYDEEVDFNEASLVEGTLVCEEIETGKRVEFFALLKHRIDHIFLPTVIDLQGISDELKENRKDLAVDYLKEVFEMRINSDFEKDKIGEGYIYYRNRLNRARYLAVGHQDANTKKALRLVALEDVEEQALKAWIASGQPEAQLPQPEAQVPDEGKAMCDLVHEAMRGLVQKTLKSQWERFIKLLGLCQVDDNTFKCNSTSPIQQFMHKMDCWLKEYPKLPEPNEVLDFFKQYQDWGIKDIRIYSFSDWFSELADAMDKLRESLKPDLR